MAGSETLGAAQLRAYALSRLHSFAAHVAERYKEARGKPVCRLVYAYAPGPGAEPSIPKTPRQVHSADVFIVLRWDTYGQKEKGGRPGLSADKLANFQRLPRT